MRTLLLAAQPIPSGVIAALDTLGADVGVVRSATDPDGTPSPLRVPTRGDPTHPRDLRWSRRALRTAVRDYRPDLLHIIADPWTPTAMAGAAAAKALSLPFALTATSVEGEARSITARWQADRVLSGAAGLAGISRPALDRLGNAVDDARPRAVLPAGGFAIPDHFEVRAIPELVTFGIVGRLVPERGVAQLIDALTAVHGAWRLLIAGTGPVQEAAEARAQRAGLASRIEWLGAVPRSQVADLWEQVDVIIAPSVSTANWVEPTGTVVVEAMAHGVAPVVSRSGALPEVVGGAGMVVDEGDVGALTRALQGFTEVPARCREIGAVARARALQEFTDAAIAAKMLAFWERILNVPVGVA